MIMFDKVQSVNVQGLEAMTSFSSVLECIPDQERTSRTVLQ
jgi:hypothetical protein